jgi:DNA-binding MarR family transcriptional regulator
VNQLSDLFTSPKALAKRSPHSLSMVTTMSSLTLAQMQTSKTSLRTYRLKCHLMGQFFDLNQACTADEVALSRVVNEPVAFVRRYLRRAVLKDRMEIIGQEIWPKMGLVRDHRAWFCKAGQLIQERDSVFGFQTAYPSIGFVGDFAALVLKHAPGATLTQVCILLALWEAKILDRQSQLTARDLASRLGLCKSTLSTAIEGLVASQQQLHVRVDPNDDRMKRLSLVLNNESVQRQQDLIRTFLQPLLVHPGV